MRTIKLYWIHISKQLLNFYCGIISIHEMISFFFFSSICFISLISLYFLSKPSSHGRRICTKKKIIKIYTNWYRTIRTFFHLQIECHETTVTKFQWYNQSETVLIMSGKQYKQKRHFQIVIYLWNGNLLIELSKLVMCYELVFFFWPKSINLCDRISLKY